MPCDLGIHVSEEDKSLSYMLFQCICVTSQEGLSDVLKASPTSNGPIELIIESGDYFSTRSIDYHGGPKFPHLERIEGKPDFLTQLGKPLAKK